MEGRKEGRKEGWMEGKINDKRDAKLNTGNTNDDLANCLKAQFLSYNYYNTTSLLCRRP